MHKAIKAVPSAGWVHLDVMDGYYVFQKTEFMDLGLVSHVCRFNDKMKDTHLMVKDPELYIQGYASAGCDIITFHVDATDNPSGFIQKIKNLQTYNGDKVGAGIALKPDEPLSCIDQFIEDVDLVLLMSVYPEKCGQSFDKRILSKLCDLSKILYSRNPYAIIQVNRGINSNNSQRIIDTVGGHDLKLLLVSGSGVYGHRDPDQAVTRIKGQQILKNHEISYKI